MVMVAMTSFAVAPSSAGAYWDSVAAGRMGWFNNAGQYTGRWISTLDYQQQARYILAMGDDVTRIGTYASDLTAGEKSTGASLATKLRAATAPSAAYPYKGVAGRFMGVLDRLGKWAPLKAFGTVSLASTALQLGWDVGGSIADVWFGGADEGDDDPLSGSNSVNLTAVSYLPVGFGDDLCRYTPSAVDCSAVVAPTVGFVINFHPRRSVSNVTAVQPDTMDDAGGTCTEFFYWGLPSQAYYIRTGKSNYCTRGYGGTGVYFAPLTVSALPGDGTGPDGSRNGTAGTPLGFNDAIDQVEDEVLEDPNDHDLSQWVFDESGSRSNEDETGLDPAREIGGPFDVTVPSCSGLVYADCARLIEELELVPSQTTLTWEDADLSIDPLHVVETQPAEGEELEIGTRVEVITNPDTDGMPLVVPAQLDGETYADYIARLEEGLTPSRANQVEAHINPNYGPDVVLQVQPQPGTRVDPRVGATVTVQTNPPDAPVPGALGTCTNLGVDPIDPAPLGVPLGDTFPFGVFGWLAGTMSAWASTSGAPSWSFSLSENLELAPDFAFIDPFMGPLRVAILIVSALGFLWFLAAAAMKMDSGISSE